MIYNFSDFINEAYVDQSVSKDTLNGWLTSNALHKMPVEALREILTWDKIYKSPHSLSFYNKPKDWNKTEPDTLRISDHWNFESRMRIHCKTKQSGITQDQWALGKYDITDGKFDILEMYDLPKYDKEKYNNLLDELKISRKDYFNKNFGYDIVEFGKELVSKIKDGKVSFINDDYNAKIIKFKMGSMMSSSRKIIIEVDGEEVTLSDPRNFVVVLDGVEYTSKELFKKLGLRL